jgi:anti-sigma-K factor RskA
MSERPPDFDALVGEDLDAAERERLLRVHALLVAAGPPPEAPTRAPVLPLARRRRRGALLAVAAALAVAAFALGVAVGDESRARTTDFVVEMSGADGASATIDVFEIDEAGNWPMELEVDGLEPPAEGKLYELWLTRDGEPGVLCGSFLTGENGSAEIPMNAPWRLSEFDGWIVVEQGSREPVLST